MAEWHKEVAKNSTSDKSIRSRVWFPLGASSAAVCVSSGARSQGTGRLGSAGDCWLRLLVGSLGLAVTAGQSQNRTELGVWATSLPCHSDPHDMSLYQIVHNDILRYLEISCWFPTYRIFSEIYQNTPRYTTVYWDIWVSQYVSVPNGTQRYLEIFWDILFTSNIYNFFEISQSN